MVQAIIEKKFKELLIARKKKQLYDFRNELKKELESALNNPRIHREKEDMKNLIHAIETQYSMNFFN
ncbi:hypothetical protein [Inediibacterium massiliense]|uniref:hypothetical protein n=1 Tax=Inediibacterium massiliense TaxID=1658111 RepID=UPI0006B3FBF1|nr:hypothetical protein [Inediibacterium massiliense]